VAQKLAESFEMPVEEASDFVRRSLLRWDDFFACRGPSHALVYFQPRFKRTEVCS